MNDIFNTDVPLKTETPAFAKHVLPAVPSSEVYLEDCVKALKRFNDNHFDLAIVDPPYGIDAAQDERFGVKTKKAGSRRTNYGKKIGIVQRLIKNILSNFLEYQKIKSFGVLITLV